jgi:hypothetical protein
MKDLLMNHFQANNLITYLQDTQNLISAAALADDYKGLDYGFTDQDFLNAIDQAWGFHVTQSIGEYLTNRYATANQQVLNVQGLQNPCTSGLTEVEIPQGLKAIQAYDVLGREIPIDAKNCIKMVRYENGMIKQMYDYE